MNAHDKYETVVLEVVNDLLAAGFVQNKLKEEGIESFLVDENVVGLNPLGGIEVKIFSKDMEKAKKILSK